MRVLFATSEIYPLIKTGGLADVSGALPLALQTLGLDVRIVLPAYRGLIEQCPAPQALGSLQVYAEHSCQIYQTTLPGSAVTLYLVAHAGLFDREGGPYHHPQLGDWHDNPLRFGLFSKATAMLATSQFLPSWQADVVHCNDWQTGLVPYYLRQSGTATASLFSIHNMAFQGNFHPDWRHALALANEDYQMQGYEFYGHLSFMKAGLQYADGLSTVSPTYAREIQTEDFGFGFQGLLQQRAAHLTGILNGIDTDTWNPATDPYLTYHYSEHSLHNKRLVKSALQSRLGLSALPDRPLLGVVSRLTYQKGLDMLTEICPALMAEGCQLVVLGSGEAGLEQQFLALQQRYPGQVSVTIGYDEALSHHIMAGADIFVMPSRFEPCGLNQMYGLRYGTIPVVANTGGLADSVQGGDITAAGVPDGMTGFVMPDSQAWTLLVTLRQAMATYANSGHWKTLQTQAMQRDVSWKSRAQAYLALYQQLHAAA